MPDSVLGPITIDVVEGGGYEAYASSCLGSEWSRMREQERVCDRAETISDKINSSCENYQI